MYNSTEGYRSLTEHPQVLLVTFIIADITSSNTTTNKGILVNLACPQSAF